MIQSFSMNRVAMRAGVVVLAEPEVARDTAKMYGGAWPVIACRRSGGIAALHLHALHHRARVEVRAGVEHLARRVEEDAALALAVAMTPRMRPSAGSCAERRARAAAEHVPERDRVEVEAADQRQVGIGEEVVDERLLRGAERRVPRVSKTTQRPEPVPASSVTRRSRGTLSARRVEHRGVRDPARPLAAQPALHGVDDDVALVPRRRRRVAPPSAA